MRLRFILGLKAKSKLSKVFSESRKQASLCRRSNRRSERRVSSSATSVDSRSIGAIGSVCGLSQTGFENVGHAPESELAQLAL